MSFHGNSKKENHLPHHLYAIMDKEADDVFKYGISDEPIGADGLSTRAREQVAWFNVIAGRLRYFAKILMRNIPGKRRAAEIETERYDEFIRTRGHPPPGNRRRKS